MIQETIKKFIESQTCATVCCMEKEDEPYCFSCYYAFDPEEGSIYFKSSADTTHAQLMKNNHFVAGTIHPDNLKKLVVKGIQFRGVVTPPDHQLSRRGATIFYKRHPLAMTIPGEIWAVRFSNLKMTDSKLGFGKKLLWSRAEEKVHAA